MKIVKYIFYLTSLCLLSCISQEFETSIASSVPEGKVWMKLHTNLGNFIKPTTRTGLADEYMQGSDVWVFFIEKNVLTMVEKVSLGSNGDIDLVVEPTTNPVTLVVLANAPENYIDSNGVAKTFSLDNLSDITTYRDLKLQLNTPSLTVPMTTVPYTSPPTSIPMSGEAVLENGIGNGVAPVVNVFLKRIVSKIVVETMIPVADFELFGATVCNAPRSGFLLSPKEPNPVYKDNSGQLVNYEYSAIGCNATVKNNIRQTTEDNPIYIYESRAVEKTAVIIQASYKGTSYFYKLMMPQDYNGITGSKDAYYRNYIYKFIINRVSGKGYATMEEAIKGDANNNIVSVSVDVTDLLSHDIIDNGSYYLGVSNSEVWLYTYEDVNNLLVTEVSFNGETVSPAISITDVVPAYLVLQPSFINNKDLIMSFPEAFQSCIVKLQYGNLVKDIPVTRFIKDLPDGSHEVYGFFADKQYIYGKIVSLSVDNSSSHWIGLSMSNDIDNQGSNEILNTSGGIYIPLQQNDRELRNAEIILGRNNEKGRLKVYLEQYVLYSKLK